MLRLSVVLGVVAFICALTLSLLNAQTGPIIEQRKQEALEQALRAVLPAQTYVLQEDAAGAYYAAYDGQTLRGWCLEAVGKGYGGPLRVLFGLLINGRITAVTVLEHQETPGLGTKIIEPAADGGPAFFLRQFRDRTVDELVLVKTPDDTRIQAVTGATISSNAVMSAVRQTMSAFLERRQAAEH